MGQQQQLSPTQHLSSTLKMVSISVPLVVLVLSCLVQPDSAAFIDSKAAPHLTFRVQSTRVALATAGQGVVRVGTRPRDTFQNSKASPLLTRMQNSPSVRAGSGVMVA